MCIFQTLIIFDNILCFDDKDVDNTLVKHWEVLNSKDFLTSARTKRLSGLRNYPLSLDPVTQDKEDRDEKDGGGDFFISIFPMGRTKTKWLWQWWHQYSSTVLGCLNHRDKIRSISVSLIAHEVKHMVHTLSLWTGDGRHEKNRKISKSVLFFREFTQQTRILNIFWNPNKTASFF